MLQFFQFLFRYRSFLLFVALEVICFSLILRNNNYQRVSFINSSNRIIGSLLTVSHDVGDFFNLVNVNGTLAEENARLRNRVSQLEQSIYDLNTVEIEDSKLTNKYRILEAKVINNSVRQFNNYITIDKGSNDGVVAGMSVLSSNGIVGKVKNSSPYFSVVNSVLHSSVIVSARLERTGDLASVQWDGADPTQVKLLYVPKHVIPRNGDKIVTSGFNSIFPPDVEIGKISDWTKLEDNSFLDISVNLTTDFSGLSYVYVITNTMKPELDSLQNEIY